MLSAAFFAAAGALAWLATSRPTGVQPPPAAGMKRLSGTVAERLVYRVPSEPFPRASCDACRMGRLKAGIFSLGGFRTIEFDNLVVNLPPRQTAIGGKATERKTEAGAAKKEERTDVVGAFGLKPLTSLSKEVGKVPRFAGVKVNGFALNRMVDQTLVPMVSAAALKNSGRRIVLEAAVVHRGEVAERVPSATLELKPRLVLKWPGGFWELPL